MTREARIAGLPTYWSPEDLAKSGILPLGDEATMRRAHAHAQSFVETYTGPWGGPATRLAREAVRHRSWKIMPMFLDASETEDRSLLRAIRTRAPAGLIASIVAGREPGPSVVWRVPSLVQGVRNFWSAHKGFETLVLPDDDSFALFSEGEQFAFLAGSAEFLRQAVAGKASDMRVRIARHAADVDRINGHTDATDLLAYYAAEMLPA